MTVLVIKSKIPLLVDDLFLDRSGKRENAICFWYSLSAVEFSLSTRF